MTAMSPNKIGVFILLNFFVINTSAQSSFRGSFLMSFISEEKNKINAPLLLNVDSGKMVMEIQDEMKKKGVSKRVLFDPVDSTWTMGIEFTNVKQATRIHAAAMFRDSTEKKKITVKVTREKRLIEG